MESDLVALAREVPGVYADLDGLRMALLTGSVARGLADNSSDVDVYLYWATVDRDALACCGAVVGPLRSVRGGPGDWFGPDLGMR